MGLVIEDELRKILSKADIIDWTNFDQHIPKFILKPPFILDVNIVDITYIYRAKYFSKWEQELSLTRFSYPPTYVNPPLSRANFEWQSVFYWWTDLRSTFLEMKDNRYEDIHISFWKLKEPRWYNFCLLTNPKFASNEDDVQRIYEENILPLVNQDVLDIRSFFDQVYTSNIEDIYNISSAISNYLLYSEWYDWVVFRSSEADAFSKKFNNPEALKVMKNIAIKPSFVDEKMELDFILKWKQTEIFDPKKWFRNNWKFDMIWFPDENWNITMRELDSKEDTTFLEDLFKKPLNW